MTCLVDYLYKAVQGICMVILIEESSLRHMPKFKC